MSEIELTDDNFDKEALGGPLPVMVDFWAPWCGPCRMLSPVIEELAKEYSGRVAVYKMNTEVHPAAASRLGISAIPNLLFLKGGKVVNQFVGVRSKADIKKALDQLASE